MFAGVERADGGRWCLHILLTLAAAHLLQLHSGQDLRRTGTTGDGGAGEGLPNHIQEVILNYHASPTEIEIMMM